MKTVEFLALSLKLLRDERTPAGLRTAISRAYYAAFHRTSEFIQGMNVSVSDGPGAHGEVRNHLVHTGDDDIDQVGLDLAHLHSERIAADYRLKRVHVEKGLVADELVNLASEVIATLNQCLSDSQRYATVVNGVGQRAKQLKGGGGKSGS
jgi:hypothetical protein